MSWLKFQMSQSGYNSYVAKPAAINKPILKTKPPTVNVNSSFCYVEQQIKESLNQIVKDRQTESKLKDLFVTYKKRKKHSKLVKC